MKKYWKSAMFNKKLKLSTLLLVSIGLTVLQAQETLPAAGGNASGTGGTVSYTVGQVVYTTNLGTNGSVAQGVQQPYEISVVSGIKDLKGISVLYSVYPNPAMDFLTLKVENNDFSLSTITYSLYDINGKLLVNKLVAGTETQISMQNLTPGTYLLKVNDGDKEVKTFKIIKNK